MICPICECDMFLDDGCLNKQHSTPLIGNIADLEKTGGIAAIGRGSMGEIAEMMLEGDLCEMCGCTLPGEGRGFPRYCSERCRKARKGPPGSVARENTKDDRE